MLLHRLVLLPACAGGLISLPAAAAAQAAPAVRWERVGHPAAARKIAACQNGDLYVLNSDATLWRNREQGRDGRWQRLGALPGATNLACADNQLFYQTARRDLYRVDPNATGALRPERMGRPHAAAQLTGTETRPGDAPVLWVLNDDRTLWLSRDLGRDGTWQRVGRPHAAGRIAATPHEVWALNTDKTLWRNLSEGRDGEWRRLDTPRAALEIAATGRPGRETTLWVLNTDYTLWRGRPERVVEVARPGDTDADGLPDDWETNGSGPIDPRVHGCHPRRQDVFIVAVLRAGATRAAVQPTLERVRQFFAAMPGRNPDGSTGINAIIVWGDSLAAADSATSYAALYERGMPRAWRGIGHGLLIDATTGGGGQTSRPDWSGVSNEWHTIVHELGHQFGLDHLPLGSASQSPLYTSLMNYDYNYSFNGDANAVHFSQGRFAAVSLDETNLSEVLNAPESALQFLTQAPYRYRLRRATATATHVDWNRNGVFGETRVRTDIDDGYAVRLQDEQRLGEAAGAPTLVAHGAQLIAVYPDLVRAADYATWMGEGLSPAAPGNIVAKAFDGRTWSPKVVLARAAGGDPHAAAAFGSLFVSYPVANSYMLHQHQLPSPATRIAMLAALDDVARGQERQPVLVVTQRPEQLWLFLWNATTQMVTYRQVTTGSSGATPTIVLGPAHTLRAGIPAESPMVFSQGPIGAAYNASVERIIVTTTERVGASEGRMRVHTLGRLTEGRWYVQNARLTEGATGGARTRARPFVMFDPSPTRGPGGGLAIYHKGAVAGGTPSATWVTRTIGDRTVMDGWRTSLVGNEWVRSRSAPSATLYRGDIAHAVRWFESDTAKKAFDHELLVNLRASGVAPGTVADHDDVTFIRTRGLRQSLGR